MAHMSKIEPTDKILRSSHSAAESLENVPRDGAVSLENGVIAI